MSEYPFPVPDTGNIKPRPVDLAFPDRIPKIKAHICAICEERVDGFRNELAQEEYLVSGMCQKCQDMMFGGSIG